MTRVQKLILIGLGGAVLVVVAVVASLLISPAGVEPIPTVPLATVPNSPALLNLVPVCGTVVDSCLEERGWTAASTLDVQTETLSIQINRLEEKDPDQVPAGVIWGAFEAAMVGRQQGCVGYNRLVVSVGEFHVEATVDDLLAWDSGAIDDGELSARVVLTR